MAEEFERLDEVAHRAAEAVESGDHNDIDPARLHLGEESIEGGATFPGARNALVDELDGLPAPGGDVLAEIVELRLARLVEGADARVERDAPRACPDGYGVRCNV
jgi:hypothetical protein